MADNDPPVRPDDPVPDDPVLGEPGGKMRIDKWLWFSRVVKSRTGAQVLVKGGKIRLNQLKIASPSVLVTTGDVLTITLPRAVRVYEILYPGTRRGPAPEAQRLYKDLTPAPEPKVTTSRPARQAVREDGAGRPTKKERREMDRFRSGR